LNRFKSGSPIWSCRLRVGQALLLPLHRRKAESAQGSKKSPILPEDLKRTPAASSGAIERAGVPVEKPEETYKLPALLVGALDVEKTAVKSPRAWQVKTSLQLKAKTS